MSEKIKKASKFGAKLFGIIAFTILFAFNIQIAFGSNTNDGISIFGQKITFFNDLFAKTIDVNNHGDFNGGGGNNNSFWFDQRVDIWTCYRTQTMFNALGLTIQCYQQYSSSVTTQVCTRGGAINQCAIGQWKWDPATPCAGGTSYPPSLLPCTF